ncbi:MAG: hypothetical protein Ct9H300mP13_0600 [Gammaproteobacteria bacterium]|nr:MAG: hypothetical protein Ct9H300mP13_0600 [Gammaproteobacteria bacterium]
MTSTGTSGNHGGARSLRKLAGEREARKSFLRYQISELETLNPEPDEWHSLDQRQTQLAHTRERARKGVDIIATADRGRVRLRLVDSESGKRPFAQPCEV